ncbi:MAG: outer membrane protein assembly factor BamB [Gammaproteobacteria bacterium]|nr:outer membrane protein assembly factor BamB [Gammaproteobacteria bacterium]
MRNTLTLFATLLLVSGCSFFSWIPFVGGDDDEKDALEPAKLVKFAEEVRVERNWKANIGEGLGRKYLKLSPLVLADKVYVADGYGLIEARDRFSGKNVWRTQFASLDEGLFTRLNFYDRTDKSFVSGGVGAGAGYVFVGTTAGEVLAISADDGTVDWTTNVGSEVLSRPTAGDGLIFVQTIDGRLLALEGKTGEIRWSFDNQVPILTLRGTSAPMFNGGVVYSGYANGMVTALRADNGEPIWEHRVMLPEGRSELDRMVDVDSAPLISGGILYAAAYQGRVKALRRSDGTMLWEKEYSSYLDLGEGYGQIYVVDDTDSIIAIDKQSAEVAWTQDGLSRRSLSSPIAFSNYLAVGDSDGYLHILAQSDGRFLGRRKLDGKGLRSNMVVADGVLYVLGNSGSLHALEIKVR